MKILIIKSACVLLIKYQNPMYQNVIYVKKINETDPIYQKRMTEVKDNRIILDQKGACT